MHIPSRSVRAAKRCADAALLNAKAVVNAEPTWLDHQDGYNLVCFALTSPCEGEP